MKRVLLAALAATLLWSGAYAQEVEFSGAREAFRAKNLDRLQVYASRLEGTLLEPYSQFWLLELRLDDISAEDAHDFFGRFGDSAMADKLRGDWLKSLGRQQKWTLFVSEYPALVNSDKELQCYAARARLAVGDTSALREAKALWFSPDDQPASCIQLFNAMAIDGHLTTDEVWPRLRLNLENSQISAARMTAQYLPKAQSDGIQSLQSVSDAPQRFLDRGPVAQNRMSRELSLFAIERIARTNPALAASYWESLAPQFSEADRAYGWGQIGFHAARQHDPQALAWYRRSAGTKLSDLQLGWRVRAGLRARDWNDVLTTIDAMSETEQKAGAWRYWKARALKETGDTVAANMIWAPQSKELNYYGQLASEELGAVIGATPSNVQSTDDEVSAVRQLPGIQRALMLYQMGFPSEAAREWQWTIRKFDDAHLLAAAEVARRADWIDRAINTADKTSQQHNLNLRFLAPHRDIAQGYIRQRQLDEAWVYGLMRQESRFVSNAKSHVGASGMMQLMPATARWVANRLGLRDFQHALVTRLDTNIDLGTYYLRYVLDRLGGNPVLATAAYNAGPARAKRWQDSKPMEGAIYTESIPFTETRDYVQKVMSNATFYANRFGQSSVSLKKRLGVIGVRSDATEPDSDAP